MLCYKLLVCLKIFVIINGLQIPFFFKPKEDDFKKQLVEAVYRYDQQIQPPAGKNCKNLSLDNGYQNGFLSQEIFERFENDLFLILKQIYSYYVAKLPDKKSIIRAITKESSEKFKITIFSEFELTICSLIPRCLDFILICAPKSSLILAIGKCHRLLCHTLPALVAQICTPDEINSQIYSCSIKRINILRKQIERIENLKPVYLQENYQDFKAVEFIINAHRCIINIDKTEIIKNNIQMYNNKPPINEFIFETVNHDYTNIKFNLAELHNRDEKKNELIEQFEFLNSNYVTSQIQNKCDSSNMLLNINQIKLPISMMINKLLLYAIKSLDKLFKLKTFQFLRELNLTSDSYIDYDFIVVWMSGIFDGICKYIPLTLLYLTENGIFDTELFSLYLMFCDDIIDFVCIRCPGTRNYTRGIVQHSVNCIIESIKDKLLWNFYTVTNTISETENIINDTCVVLALSYVRKAYEILTEYYDGLSVDVWTTFDWLSGKYFLTKEYYSNAEIDELKETEIKVNNVTMTLSEAYYLVLPLNSNVITVLTFHNIILFYLDRQFNFYVYRHAKTIVLYFEFINTVKKSTLDRLKGSLSWYKTIKVPFYKYLSLPVKHEPRVDIINIITAVEKLDNYSEVVKIKMTIPGDINGEIISWTDNVLKDANNIGYVNGLNQLIMSNCSDAMHFFNTFMSIVQTSLSSDKVIDNDTSDNSNNGNNDNLNDVYQKLCSESVNEIFFEKLNTPVRMLNFFKRRLSNRDQSTYKRTTGPS
ncbi:Hypothetical protein CINCED_3A010751 [Cinara cedri]|uniref:Uncharacterized protein n=1 Tax=Cinara cedri TaxID=506608 RepID=A0A5E4M3K7_9HEMI|nr:Hypothetical protein CINCED_3A010751 [Cinara cedri]